MADRLRVLVVARWYPAVDDRGAGVFVADHCAALTAAGVEVRVASFEPALLTLGDDATERRLADAWADETARAQPFATPGGWGAPGVPVARSDRLIVGAHLHPIPGVRFGAQAYAAGLDGLVLVAPRNGEPFSTRGFATGRGWARGVSLESAASGQWYGMMASWAFQHVRATHGDSSYTPGYASGHLVELGVVVFPAATTSLRLAFTGELDRRGTDILGGFEWESCNLLDQGCEFAGSPLHDSRNPGSTPLPDYFRLDLGVRKHWHIEVGGRDVELGMFGTVTNLFGRRNVLAFATDLASGKRTVIAMRPLAPLVVGLDWRF